MITNEYLDNLIDSIFERPMMHCQNNKSFDDMMFLLIFLRYQEKSDINNILNGFQQEIKAKYLEDYNRLTPLSDDFGFDTNPTIVDVWSEIKNKLK